MEQVPACRRADERTDMPAQLKPRTANEEVWEIQVPGMIYLQVTAYNRQGQPMNTDLALGPNRAGHQFRITADDRLFNQERCTDEKLDPFRNGMLTRVDADQQVDEDTASKQALSAADLVTVFDLHGAPFHNAVGEFDEIVLRRLHGLGDSVDATAKQMDYLDELIRERYGKGAAQDLENAVRLT